MRVTEVGRDYDTQHIVLDLGKTPFPVLEGQSIGILPPGSTLRGGRTMRGSTRWPAHGTVSAPASTTCR